MTRNEFTDKLNYCRREYEFLAAVKPGCHDCHQFNRDQQTCKTYGPVPSEHVETGCDDWEFLDTPF